MLWLKIRSFGIGRLLLGASLILITALMSTSASPQSEPAAVSPGRAHINQVLQGLNRGRPVGQVAVSPDGKRVAWIEGMRDGGKILVAPLDDLTKAEHVSAGVEPDQHCRENSIAWEPDAKALAFLSDCAQPGEQADLFLSKLDGNPPRRLTELRGYVEEPAFSPDGKRVAFLYVEGATRPAGALAAMKAPSGVMGEDGVEIQRVAVAAVDTESPEAPEQVTPASLHVYEFDWAPDSKALAYVAADPPGENNWWVAKLYVQAIEGAPKAILTPSEVTGPMHGMQIAVPRWSPDEREIAFIGGLMSDQGSTGGDVWIISAAGGGAARSDRGPAHFAGLDRVGQRRIPVCERECGRQRPAHPAAFAGRSDRRRRGQLRLAHLQHSRQRGRRADGRTAFPLRPIIRCLSFTPARSTTPRRFTAPSLAR